MHTRFLGIVVLFVAAAVIVISAINFRYAPGASRDRQVSADIARNLLEGRYVEIDSDFEDRFVQKAYIRHVKSAPDVVVLGSSRSLQIRRELFKGLSFFNHASWGSTLIDYMGILGMYESRGWLPAIVVIGVDPWVFNKNNDQKRWWPLFVNYRQMLATLEDFDSELPALQYLVRSSKALFDVQLSRLASIGQSRRTLEEVWACRCLVAFPRTHYRPRDDDFSRNMVKRPDGSLRYVESERMKSVSQLRKEAVKFGTAVPIYGFREYVELDLITSAHFEALVKFLTARKVKVMLFLSPYHPAAYERMNAKKSDRMVKVAEDYLRKIAVEFGAEVVGSYDPTMSGCTESEFLDAHHPNEACVARVFANRSRISALALRSASETVRR